MKFQIEISEQVFCFVQKQPPDVRKFLREGLRSLEKEGGDIKSLEEPLGAFFRLRIRSYRVIFRYHPEKLRSIQCIFAEKRGIIYEVFEEMVERGLKG